MGKKTNMDSVRLTEAMNNNLAYKVPDLIKRPNTSHLDSAENTANSYISPHKKLCKESLQYNNNNNEYISEGSDESDSETPNPYSPPLVEPSGVPGQALYTSPLLHQSVTGVYPSTQTPEGLDGNQGITSDRKKTKGRLKVEMKYLEDKLKRNTTFNKRKNGMLKKAFELSTLTGTEILVVIASEAGYIHTFATKKLQPVIASQQGQEFIQDCLMNDEDTDCETDQVAGNGTAENSTPTQSGVISKWKATKQQKTTTTAAAQAAQPPALHQVELPNGVLPQLPLGHMQENGVSPSAVATVSSPLYGLAAKSEPMYDGIYGQMPQSAQQQYSAAMYGQVLTQEDKSNSSTYSNLSPPPPPLTSTSILQGALSGTTDINSYVQQYISQSNAHNATVLKLPAEATAMSSSSVVVNEKTTPIPTPSSVQVNPSVGYTYSLASQSAADFVTSMSQPAQQYTHVQSAGTSQSSADEVETPQQQQQGTSPQEANAEYEFQTDPGKTVYIEVPVKKEPGEVGCYWS